MPTHIKVAIRLRPFLQSEANEGHSITKISTSESKRELYVPSESTQRVYKFDKIFGQQSTQTQVFEGLELTQLLQRTLEGYHATIFAYGQTGSGKTYSMEGYEYVVGKDTVPHPLFKDDDRIGITQRSINKLYELKSQVKTQSISISCSFLQIYNEKVFDLLNMNGLNDGLKMRWNPKDQFTVENLFVIECKSADDVITIFKKGIGNRVVASHRMNIASSRSHTIFSIIIESTMIDDPAHKTTSKLEFVDLAGSEKISLVSSEPKHVKESIDINRSLFNLRKVISLLSQKNKQIYIPYRDSKLTSLLKQSLGGSSYCLMVACLNPSDAYFEENISTISYASMASTIVNEPIINEEPLLKRLREYESKIAELEDSLKKANQHIEMLTSIAKSNINNDSNITETKHLSIAQIPTENIEKQASIHSNNGNAHETIAPSETANIAKPPNKANGVDEVHQSSANY